jgi:hypothetical protein
MRSKNTNTNWKKNNPVYLKTNRGLSFYRRPFFIDEDCFEKRALLFIAFAEKVSSKLFGERNEQLAFSPKSILGDEKLKRSFSGSV